MPSSREPRSGNQAGNPRAQEKAERDLLAAERERMAVELRMQGYEFDEIAIECGYLMHDGRPNASAAYKAWKRVLHRVSAPAAETARAAIVRSHNVARRGLWKDFKAGKTWAIDAWVLMEQEESKLFGYYAEKHGQQGPPPNVIIASGTASAIQGVSATYADGGANDSGS